MFFLFKVCCAVKSKATKHKICGVYFQIRNLPSHITSKISNIFLIALASSEDLKNDAVLNDLNELIFDELSELETKGFQTTDGKVWKAALINISGDNLGLNTLLGMSKGFMAHYYCRMCEMHRDECGVMTRELPGKLRTKESHQENIELMEENPTNKPKGVRMECLYNRLLSYDIFENISLDIMHDMHEGNIPYFLSAFFEYCISKKIESEYTLIRKIRDYNYGPLFDKNKPSILGLKKHHLGQSASQSYCLILHLPFIFYDLQNKLKLIWPILEALLQCLQIVMSTKITELDLKRLEKSIDIFLNGMITLKGKLIPKAHFLTHYANAIRKVGPLKHMWTMRFECKHMFFTDAARLTHNFINLKKTLAYKHQEKICLTKFSVQNEIEESKKIKLFCEHCDFTKYDSFLSTADKNIDFDYLFMLPFLSFNDTIYKNGLILIENFSVYEILFVLKSQNDYYFLCELYEMKAFDHSLHSIEIQPYCSEKQLAYIKHCDLSNSKSFSKKMCNGKIYVIAENLNVFNPSNELA